MTSEIHQEKVEHRRKMKKILSFLTPEDKALRSMNFCVHFIQSELFTKADSFLAFVPMKDEVDIMPILKQAMSQNKNVLLPKMNKSNEINFCFMENSITEKIHVNPIGFFEPKPDCPVCDFEDSEKLGITVVLTPGLAFDKENNRLGRGGGCYDSFLSKLRQTKTKNIVIGVCYNEQYLEKIPCCANDEKVDSVIAC